MSRVSSISTHKLDKDAGEYVLLVHWEGLEEIEASWERLSKLMRECPAVVQAYVKTIKSKKMKEERSCCDLVVVRVEVERSCCEQVVVRVEVERSCCEQVVVRVEVERSCCDQVVVRVEVER
ncbi:unnamed protein product [Aphanomyces euteiches]